MDAVGVNMACVAAADSFYIGGNWGFILKSHPDFNQMYSIMKKDGNVKIYEVENGIIVFVNPNYLHSVLSQVDETFTQNPVETQKILNRHQNRASEEITNFKNYLLRVLKGSATINRTPDYEEFVFAIYSCNNLHKLRLNGIEYPAFSITEVEAIKEIVKMRKYGEVYFAVENGFKNITELSGDKGINEVLKGLEISPTMNGTFMTVRFVRKM